MEKTIAVTREKSIAAETAGTEISKIGIYTIGTTSALIGSWAVMCLVSGMVSSGGPVGLAANYVLALNG